MQNLTEILSTKKIIIFGSGEAGQAAVKILRAKGLEPFCFHDNKVQSEIIISGIPVKKLDLNQFCKDFVFILTMYKQQEAEKELLSFGIKDFFPIWCLIDKNSSSFLEPFELEKIKFIQESNKTKKLTLNSLDFVITERCSLKCKECSNLMQFYKNPQNYNFEFLKQQINILSKVFDEIYEVRILGGEPFVNLDCGKIIEYIYQNKLSKRIVIYTNATIIPNEETLLFMKKANTFVSMSDYGDLSRKKKEFIKLLSKFDIPYELKTIDFWTKCSTFKNHKRSKKALEYIYKNCCCRNVITLLNGKIYGCPFIANAMNLRAIPCQIEDFVDLFQDLPQKDLKEKIRNMLNRNYYDSCNWCEGRPDIPKENDKIPPHEQIKKALDYTEILNNDFPKR